MNLAKRAAFESTKTGAPNILLVEDEPATVDLVRARMALATWKSQVAHSIPEMWQQLSRLQFDVLVLDIFLDKERALDEMERLIQKNPQIRIVVMTGSDSVGLAIEAMKKGASGFVCKSQGIDALIREVEAVLAQSLGTHPSESFSEGFGLIGSSLPMKRVRQAIERVKDVNSTVLVLGESGTGKELVAQALHDHSIRSKHRFAALNCGAIPENLLESELFGHKQGSFTDAKRDRQGYFELCSGGTLFLDEIGEMPLALQVKLLRVLERREVTPVGGSVPILVDTRIVAATNRDLPSEVAAGRFREDLFYRLSVLGIEIPPLRERTEDIPRLVHHFIDRFNSRFQKFVHQPGHEIMARLTSSNWKGNVRELQNSVERAVVLAQGSDIEIDDLFPRRGISSVPKSPTSSQSIPADWVRMPFAEVESQCQYEYFANLLRATRGNISEVARVSGEHRARIYRILKKLEIDPESFKAG